MTTLTTDTFHPYRFLETVGSPQLEARAGRCLANADIAVNFIEDKGVITQINAARLSDSGDEIAVLGLSFPASTNGAALRESLQDAGLRVDGHLSFDEALAALEAIGSKFDAQVTHTIPELGAYAFPARDFTHAKVAPISPAESRDTLTGLRGKAALYSHEALQELNARVAGSKVFIFIDFNNMGVANKFGLTSQVDEVLRSIKSAAADAFPTVPFELFRVGGDEFVLVVSEEGSSVEDSVQRFRERVQTLRDRAFCEQSGPVEAAESFARVRSRARNLFADYLREIGEQETFSLRGFRQWIVEQMEAGFLPDRRSTGRMAVELAIRKLEQEDFHAPGVMSFSCAAAHVGTQLTPEKSTKALGVCDKLIHAQKEGRLDPFRVAIASEAQLDEVAVRAATGRVIEDVQHASRRFIASQERLERLREEAVHGMSNLTRARAEVALRVAAGLDPSVSENVLRYSIVKDMKISDFMVPGSQGWVSALMIDVNHFGVINNQLGYDRGDDLIGKIAHCVRDVLPASLIVRKDGGRLVVFTAYGTGDDKIHSIWTRADLALRESVHSEVASAEYQIRAALDSIAGLGRKGKDALTFKRVRVEEGVLNSLSEMTFEQAIERLETNKLVLERIKAAPGAGRGRIWGRRQ